MQLNGATRVVMIVGDPIAQVKSPEGITAAMQQAGRNAIVMPAHVTAAELTAFLDGVGRMRNLDGLIVTVPHKFACFAQCATATRRAQTLEAVNIMRRNADGGWQGEMSDGEGFVGAVRGHGFDPQGRRALMIGAGGAGSAIGLALLDAGAHSLAIHDADSARRDALIARLDRVYPGQVSIGSPDPRGHDLIANASPAGMHPDDPYPVDIAGLDASMFAGCVITAPAEPRWIAAARARGCASSTGIDMFRAQQGLIRDFLLNLEAPGT